MRARHPNLAWVGVVFASSFWLLEAVIHTVVFRDGDIWSTLQGENDPNELWMRLIIVVLFLGFGVIADRTVRAERRVKENAERVGRLLRFVDHVSEDVQHPSEVRKTPASAKVPPAELSQFDFEDTVLVDDDIGRLSRTLRALSSHLDVRFDELHALLQLTSEINKGLLLDDVMEKAWRTLRNVIPYHRLGIALLEDRGRMLRARWARSDGPKMRVPKGYVAPMAGSSLERILATQEPRIINDLAQYLEEHPRSESTRLLVAEGIRSSLTCPLISMGKPIGFCFFSSRRAGVYRDAHVEVFKLIAAHLSVVVEKGSLYQEILQEKEKSESLLLNVMPARIAARLRSGEKTIADSLVSTSVIFADIVDFTRLAGRLTAEQVFQVLQDVFGRFDRDCDRHGIEKIKTIGDAYMAISGPNGSTGGDRLEDMAEFALEMLESVRQVRPLDGEPIRIRIGMHTGPVVAGVIDQKKFAYDVWGDTVNVASRMLTTAEPGRIQVTEEVHARLQDAFAFEFRGETGVKGKGGMKTWFLTARKGA